ncbi:hypothetical protein AB3S75_028705, partial [Citrus x aurantiifolia]
RVLWTPVSSTL